MPSPKTTAVASWTHQSAGTPGRIGMAVIAAGWAAAGVVGLVAGRDLTQQVVGPVVAFAGAGLFANLAFVPPETTQAMVAWLTRRRHPQDAAQPASAPSRRKKQRSTEGAMRLELAARK